MTRLELDARRAFRRLSRSRHGLLDCYAAADVFVFASRTETQGLVLLEAHGAGRAGRLDRRAGHGSILKPGCGALVVPRSTDEFAPASCACSTIRRCAEHLDGAGRALCAGLVIRLMARRLAELYGDIRCCHAPQRVSPDSRGLIAAAAV